MWEDLHLMIIQFISTHKGLNIPLQFQWWAIIIMVSIHRDNTAAQDAWVERQVAWAKLPLLYWCSISSWLNCSKREKIYWHQMSSWCENSTDLKMSLRRLGCNRRGLMKGYALQRKGLKMRLTGLQRVKKSEGIYRTSMTRLRKKGPKLMRNT